MQDTCCRTKALDKRLDEIRRLEGINTTLLEGLTDAKSVIGRLIALIEQHHATTNCNDSGMWAMVNTEYKALDRARQAISAAKS